ncbi:fungal hydrophobin [Flagelloscypha sp. PMI_526]|nr:fungal hydrophobin [Flagelloscypha sp. PMI_526]
MRSFTTIVFAALLVFLVSAMPAVDTNAQRMARGLPLKAPRHLYKASPVSMARRDSPSGTPGQCNVGKVQCCNSVTRANDKTASLIASLLGIVLPTNAAVGLNCSPLSVIGVGGNSCNTQPVCCENNSFNGLIAIGCTPSKPV